MCAIVRPLADPPVFERGVTEISYGVQLSQARSRAPRRRSSRRGTGYLQRTPCNAFTPVKGGFSQTCSAARSRARQGAVAIRRLYSAHHGRRADRRRAVHDSDSAAHRRCCSISTTRFSMTAATWMRAGARHARAMPTAWRHSSPMPSSDHSRTSKWFWSDPERHRTGRLELDLARREVVRLALKEIGHRRCGSRGRNRRCIRHRRDIGMEPLPDAIDTVRWLRDRGCRLALLTNGAGPAQRKKIARFGLDGSLRCDRSSKANGFGKPDERVYRLALDGARCSNPTDAWMVGDNLEWDVARRRSSAFRQSGSTEQVTDSRQTPRSPLPYRPCTLRSAASPRLDRVGDLSASSFDARR